MNFGLRALALLAGCSAEPVAVERSPYLEVFSETAGTVEASGVTTEIGPDAPARLFVGDGSRRLRFQRGDVTVVLPEADGPSIRLDPFLRAAGLRPDPRTTWRVAPEDVEGQTFEGVVVGAGVAWPATRLDDALGKRLEAAGPAGDGLWVVGWREGGRLVALSWDAGAGGAAARPLGRRVEGRGELRVAYDTDGEAWAEVLPVFDDVPVPMALAAGVVGRNRALALPADWGPDVRLAVRLRVRAVGQTAPDVDRLFALARGVTSVLLPATPLAPMGPTPADALGTAVPIGGTTPSVAWVPPESTAFWGLTLADTQGCEPGHHWVFGGPEDATLALPAGLSRAGLLVGGVWGYALAAPLDFFTAAEARPPTLLDWTSAVGIAGFVRGAVDDCPAGAAAAGPTGRFGIVSSGADPCDEASVRATVVTDACGRMLLAPLRDDDTTLEVLRCGHWGQGSFTDAAGRSFQVRRTRADDGADGYTLSHPAGAFEFHPLTPAPEVPVPPTEVLGTFSRVEVAAHLERPDFPGEALLGTQRAVYAGTGRDGPFLQVEPDGGLHAAWPGTDVVGSVNTGGSARGPWPVHRVTRLCRATTPSTQLRRTATGVSLVVGTTGPERLGRPTVRILTATFSR